MMCAPEYVQTRITARVPSSSVSCASEYVQMHILVRSVRSLCLYMELCVKTLENIENA